MIEMRFTIKQDEAIHFDHSNILVNAGAGSGKTAVLSERVLRKLSEGVHIDDLIILTFTNAAASEMKSRIKEKILETSSLIEELKHLDNAVISTFDSFALRVVKEYHYLLDLPDDVHIVDSLVLQKSKESLLDETMNERYVQKDERFLKTIDRLYDRGDSAFREAVLVLAKGMETIPNYPVFLTNYERNFYSDEKIQTVFSDYESLLKKKMEDLRIAFDQFQNALSDCPVEKVQAFVETVARSYHVLFSENDPDRLFTSLKNFSHPNLPRLSKEDSEYYGETLKDANEALKKNVNGCRDEIRSLFAEDLNAAKTAYLEPKETVLSVVDVTAAFLAKMDAFKRKNNFFDYGDIMNLAIQLFEQHPDIQRHYQETINEILVDEYQDTNDLQDYLLSLLEQNNLFMVGDVKQSIYGFRNANPKNFIRKYHNFDANGFGKTIDLLENFRSRPEILAGINQFFASVMSEKIGGVNYHDRQALVFGNKQYLEFCPSTQEYGPELLVYHDDEEQDETPATKISTPAREGAIIAFDISSKIAQGYQIYDVKTKQNHAATYRDFAILVDRKSGFEQMEKTLVAAGLPVFAIADEHFIASSEILFINNALQLIKCCVDESFFKENFRLSFYGVGRSFVYEIGDETLVSALLSNQYQHSSDLTSPNAHPTIQKMLSDFTTLANNSLHLPVDELLLALYRQTNLFVKIAILPDPENVEKKLLFLLEKAKELPNFTLDDLIDYFAHLYESGELDVEFSKPYDPEINAVRLMTMHKSKGLEFPICYYPGLGKRFNYAESKAFFAFDRQYGLVTKAWDEGFKDTILHHLVKQKNATSDVSERIRLFYVALTRAQEKMILVMDETRLPKSKPIYDENGYLAESIRRKYHSFRDLVLSIPETKKWRKPVDENRNQTSTASKPILENETPIQYRKIEIKAIEQKEQVYSKQAIALRSRDEMETLKSGNQFHRELEHIDFHHLDSTLTSVSPLIRTAIQALVDMPSFSSLQNAKIYQEYEFFENTETGIRHGIIDLMAEYPDHIDILDYKLSHLTDEAYRTQLSGYRDFIMATTKKPVTMYLYSLTTCTLSRIGG